MKICIDAGHNYSRYDTGAVGNGLKEQDITFDIADKLEDLLKSVGVEVVMTRPKITTNVGKNANDSINERCRIANNTKCDYFISIHCNAFADTSAKGTETLIYGIGGEAEKLANKVNAEIVKSLKTTNRGIKVRTNLGVLKNTNMPAILVETAFITNASDAQLLKNKQVEFAKAIFTGVCDYLGIEKKTSVDSNKIETGNDIDYALKWKYGITFESLADEKELIKEIDTLKAKNSEVYKVLYQLANKK